MYGQKILNLQQKNKIDKTSQKYKLCICKGGMIMLTCTIQKWGNSQGIRIPKALLNELNIRENEILSLEINNNKLIIQKRVPEKISIKKLFANYKGDYTPNEIDWGNAKGVEIW